MSLRFSYYEGHSIRDITFPTRLLSRLGVETLIGESYQHPTFEQY